MINESLIPTFGLSSSHDHHIFAKSSFINYLRIFSLVSKISFLVSFLFRALVDTSIPTYHLNFIFIILYMAEPLIW